MVLGLRIVLAAGKTLASEQAAWLAASLAAAFIAVLRLHILVKYIAQNASVQHELQALQRV